MPTRYTSYHSRVVSIRYALLTQLLWKARRSGVTEVLFAKTTLPLDEPSTTGRTEREFGLAINVYRLTIDALLRVALSIARESSRVQLLTQVGEELNDRVAQPAHKVAWQELLQRL